VKRREFIAAASAALLVSPRRSWAQGKPRRVGFLTTNVVEPTVQKAWLEGLRGHGWIDVEGGPPVVYRRGTRLDKLLGDCLRKGNALHHRHRRVQGKHGAGLSRNNPIAEPN
jgi:hypothetical protein